MVGLGWNCSLRRARIQRAESETAGGWGLVHVPVRPAHPHSVVAALKDGESRLVMPHAQSRRSLLLSQGLAAEAVRRGHEVRKARGASSRVGGVDVAFGEYR